MQLALVSDGAVGTGSRFLLPSNKNIGGFAVKALRIAFGLAVAGIAGTACATTTIYDFAGTISLITPGLEPLNGTGFSGSFTYNGPGLGCYTVPPGQQTCLDVVTALQVSFDGFTVTLPDGEGLRGTSVPTNLSGFANASTIQIYSVGNTFTFSHAPGSLVQSVQSLELYFADGTGATFAPGQFPETIDFNSYTAPFNRLFLQTGTGSYLRGEITSLVPSAVPEPATWAMMLIGFGVMGVALRRRRKMATFTQLEQ